MKKQTRFTPLLATLPLLIAAALQPAHAQEARDVEEVRATTMAILQALVENGLLSREKADAIVKQAQQSARAKVEASQAVSGAATGAVTGAVAGSVSGAASAGAPDASGAAPNATAAAGAGGAQAAGRNVIRVPYVSETVKNEIREQLRQDVLAQAKAERWGNPEALPSWLRHLTLEGDVRVRWQSELFGTGNLAADAPLAPYLSQNDPLAANTVAWAPDLVNTTHDRQRMTLRARLGVSAALGEGVNTGIRVATGANTSPVSTSQTLGSGGGDFGKYSIWLDRAFVQWSPRADFTLNAGRFANPFYGTDLTWPDDLNFDGLSASYKNAITPRSQLFATVGAFPLQEFELTSADKWLYGAQVGSKYTLDYDTSFDVGLAYYNFNNVEGVFDPNDKPADLVAGAASYLSSEYPKAVRQKGNSLIRINSTQNSSGTYLSPVWGLASKYRPLDLSFGATFNQFGGVAIRTTFDYVKNTGFNANEIAQRAVQTSFPYGKKNTGLQARIDAGSRKIDKRGDWQAFMAWRRLERDAWIDAFTDTTWHLGGTNYQGWSLGGQYGIAPRTSVGARLTSTHNLTDGYVIQTFSGGAADISSAPLKIDVFQLELNSRF